MLKLRLIDCKQRDVQDLDLVPSYAGQTGWLVGNNANCDLVLPDSDVDCLYGRIFYYKGLYHFVDLGGKTESLINGEPVPVGNPRQLCEGDLLQVGRTLLYFKAFSVPSTTSERSLSSSPEQDYSQAYLQNYSQSYSQNHFQNHPLERSPTEERICRCTEIIEETADVKTFCLAPESPFAFEYQPGQFVNLQVEINGQSVIRPYTLSSSPSRSGLAITVKRCPAPSDRPDAPIGLVSNWLHDYLQPGDRVRLVGGAMGHFTCLPKVPAKMLLISAGSGITPLMSMARWVKDTLLDTDIVFLYSTRTPRDFIFRTELAEMTAQMPNFHLAVTLTRPSPNQAWMGLTGRVSESMLNLVVPDLLERSVYVCGSEGFTENVKSILEAIHFPMSNYYSESFGGSQEPPTQPLISDFPPSPTRSAAPAAAKPQNGQRNGHHPTSSPSTASPSTATNTLSIVTFAQSDREVLANSSSSLLELAEQAGVTIRSACRVGACGACKVATRDGKVQYDNRPPALTPADEEVGYALACVARPAGALVVEA